MQANAFTIVTGASRGIGAAIALCCARAGHALALVAVEQKQRLAATAAAAQAFGVPVSTHVCDVSSASDVEALFRAIRPPDGARLGLVNNAALTGDRSALADMPVAQIDQILATNVRGTLLCCARAVRLMSAAGGGAIVNLSSQSAIFGGNGLTAYAASKAAVNGLTVSLAREVAPQNIRVNAVSPGPVLTEPVASLPPERLRDMLASLPMHRFCTPEEVAETVLWLLSEHASYVSGAIVPVHGAR